MAAKRLALYTRSDDVDAFLQHHGSVHTPLVDQVPGLVTLLKVHDVGD